MNTIFAFSYFVTISLATLGVEVFNDQLVQPPEMSTPKRGSVKGDFAELGAKAVQLSTGGFSIELPISLPSERGAILHPFSVAYSPSFGLSEFGLGWDLSLCAWRSVEIGQIDFSSDDLITPWGRLVLGTDGFYYSKDLRQKVRADLNGRELTIFLADGRVALLGDTSQDFNEIHAGGQTYSWCLKEISDQVGKLTRYQYQRFSAESRLYLDRIEYGGMGTDFQYQVVFGYENTHRNYQKNHLGVPLISSHRVSQISIQSLESVGFQERHRYEFDYESAEESPAFYLTQSQKIYFNGSAEPASSFSYDRPKNFLLSTQWKRDTGLDFLGSNYRGILTLPSQTSAQDFNLDGLVDLEIGKTYQRYLQTENGFAQQTLPAPTGEIGKRCLFPVIESREVRRYQSFFGAGTSPLVYKHFEWSGHGALEVCEPNGQLVGRVVLPKFWQDQKTTIVADYNKDTLPDIIHLGGKFFEVMLNSSSGGSLSFAAPSSRSYLNLPSSYHSFWLRDIDGDGASDLVLKGDSTIYVHHGMVGGGFQVEPKSFDFYLPSGAISSKNLKDSQVLFVDFNKDGLADILLQGEGFVTLHLNTSTHFVQLLVPGLFANSQIYQNILVADLGATGGQQLASAVREGSDYFVLTLDFDRPSLGLLDSVNDGKGNEVSFEFSMSEPEPGVLQRKSVLTRILRTTTGEGSFEESFLYDLPVAHTLSKGFLGFQRVDKITPNQGQQKNLFSYDLQNLQTRDLVETFDYERPDLVNFEQNTFSYISLNGVVSPFLSSSESGYRTADSTTSNSKTTIFTTSSTTLCETSRQTNGASLNQTMATSYFNLASFADHFACLSHEQTLSATGANSYSHRIRFDRDAHGRVTHVFQGASGAETQMQQIGYGANGRISSVDNASSGLTSVYYDSNYRLNRIVQPDLVDLQIPQFEFLNDQPLERSDTRDTKSFSEYFRFDDFGRLQKQWDNLGNYSEATPKQSFLYQFADPLKPGKIWQTRANEINGGALASHVALFLQTASGKSLATLRETASNYRVSGLTQFDQQNLVAETVQDHLFSLSTDLDAIAAASFDFTQNKVAIENQEILGDILETTTAVQTGVDHLKTVDKTVTSTGVERKITENNNSSLSTTSLIDEFGQTISYIDQAGAAYSYERDSLGRIKKITFPDGIEQTVTYESRFGKISEIERTHLGKITYSYDLSTSLLAVKTVYDSAGIQVRSENYSYDSVGRLLQKTLNAYDGAGLITDNQVFDYLYDGAGLDPADQAGQTGFLNGIDTAAFSKKMVYREDGKLKKQIVLVPGYRKIIFENTYNSQGELESVVKRVLTEPGAIELLNYRLDYLYDRFGNLVEIKKDSVNFASLTYNNYQQVDQINLSGSKDINYFYDSRTRRMNVYREDVLGVALFQQTMSWNNRNLIESSDTLFGTRLVANDYSYSQVGFLTDQSQTDTGGTAKSHTYHYDEVGSAIQYGSLTSYQLNGGTAKTVVSNATTWTVDGVAYSLDGIGRVSSKGTKSFVYGANGRIGQVKNSGVLAATYIYDENHQPILKNPVSGNSEIYLGDLIYDGTNLIEPISVGKRVVGYFENGVFKRTSQDHLNSFLLDEMDSYSFVEPFGERASRATNVSKALDFTLKGYDGDIEAVRMGSRFYDPKAKRFLAPDKLFFEKSEKVVSSPFEGGLYLYALNDPINKIDPDGQQSLEYAIKSALSKELTPVTDKIKKTGVEVKFSAKHKPSTFEKVMKIAVRQLPLVTAITGKTADGKNMSTSGRAKDAAMDFITTATGTKLIKSTLNAVGLVKASSKVEDVVNFANKIDTAASLSEDTQALGPDTGGARENNINASKVRIGIKP